MTQPTYAASTVLDPVATWARWNARDGEIVVPISGDATARHRWILAGRDLPAVPSEPVKQVRP